MRISMVSVLIACCALLGCSGIHASAAEAKQVMILPVNNLDAFEVEDWFAPCTDASSNEMQEWRVAAGLLRKTLPEETISVTALSKDTLLVTGQTREALDEVKTIVHQLDKPVPHVMILIRLLPNTPEEQEILRAVLNETTACIYEIPPKELGIFGYTTVRTGGGKHGIGCVPLRNTDIPAVAITHVLLLDDDSSTITYHPICVTDGRIDNRDVTTGTGFYDNNGDVTVTLSLGKTFAQTVTVGAGEAQKSYLLLVTPLAYGSDMFTLPPVF